MENKLSTAVLAKLSPKKQGLTEPSSVLLGKMIFEDITSPKGVEINLENEEDDNLYRTRIVFSKDNELFSFPIQGVLNFSVVDAEESADIIKMYSALSKTLRFQSLKIVRVEDSVENGVKIYPIFNYALYQEATTLWYSKNPTGTSEEFWKVHPRLRTQCREDGRILDDKINFKDITCILE
jgi:hypothetical protein